jgi:hypothetical protein
MGKILLGHCGLLNAIIQEMMPFVTVLKQIVADDFAII